MGAVCCGEVVVAGASLDSPRAPTCTFQGLSLQTPPKFNERTPREKKESKLWREKEKKKARNFGRSGGGGVRRRGCPAEGVPPNIGRHTTPHTTQDNNTQDNTTQDKTRQDKTTQHNTTTF